LEKIRERNRHRGMRIKVPVTLGSARVVLQIDMGFGDAVYPAPTTLTIEPLLDLEPPTVLAYPLEAVVAEKLEAMVSIGMLTSRMKDFYDICAVASARTFDRGLLVSATEATFERRGTTVPDSVPAVLTDAMPEDPAKAAQWAAFLRRIGRTLDELPLDRVVTRAREFLCIVWDQELADRVSAWTPESGWH
ncbi:MAG: nucleotidyl transferase AbiEii/AbiGii toxin family protein, partial [bacterium]